MLHKARGYVVEMQTCAQVVPGQHLQCRQLVRCSVTREMGKADPSLFLLPVGRDKEEIIGCPLLLLRRTCGRTLLHNDAIEDAPQGDDRKLPWLEFHKEDAPRLTYRQRPKALDLGDLRGTRWIDPEL